MQVSFSSLQTFLRCRYQYWQHYVLAPDAPDRLPEEPNAFAEYGTFVHSLLERYERGELEVYELSRAFTDGYREVVPSPFPESPYTDMESLFYNNALDFFDSFDGLDDYKILGVEEEFLEPVTDEIVLHGFIDLVMEAPDGKLIIRDWKSKAGFTSRRERREYARQLYLYSLHVRRKTGRYPDLLQFYHFRKQLPTDIPFRDGDYHEALDWVKRTVSEISRCAQWDASYNEWFCSHLCEYRNSCPMAGG